MRQALFVCLIAALIPSLVACVEDDDRVLGLEASPEVEARLAQALVEGEVMDGTVNAGAPASLFRVTCYPSVDNCISSDIYISTTDWDDTVVVTLNANRIDLSFLVVTRDPATGETVATQTLTCGPDTYACGTSSRPHFYRDVVVFLGGGDDSAMYTSPHGGTFGYKYDHLNVDRWNYGSTLTAYGESGDDTIRWFGHAEGGAGNDTLVAGSSGSILVGGSGADTLTGSGAADLLFGHTADLNGLYNYRAKPSGSDSANTISGGGGDDELFGGSGNDTMHGGDGDDRMYGWNGSDTMNGDANNDLMYGGNDGDTMKGGSGNDTMYGEPGRDTMWGGANDDTMYGNDGRDTMYGDDGKDKLYGGSANDTLDGGAGSDKCSGEKKKSC